MIETVQALPEGVVVSLVLGGQQILLCNVAGEHFAISDVCSHGRTLLSGGKLRGHVISCPLHGARFDVRSGKCLSGPAVNDVASFPVILSGDTVTVAT